MNDQRIDQCRKPNAIRVLDWWPLPQNSLFGFARIEMPSGTILTDVCILTGERRPWASPPSKPLVGADGVATRAENGKIRYQPLVEFASKTTRTRWSDAVIEALRHSHPESLS